jgi:formate hydrogenlyase subunit 6/NADH:ubiquinone oxidoreductase subunit I
METKNKGSKMSGFLKIAFRNLLKGPTTDPYPFGETFIPENLRGRLSVDASICTACGTCQEVCPSGAINITKEDGVYLHTVWYNTCCYCGNCEFFCPTGAIVLSNNFHTANVQEDKYKFTTTAQIHEVECAKCAKKFVPATMPLIEKSYPSVNDRILEITRLCPECRKKSAFERLYL